MPDTVVTFPSCPVSPMGISSPCINRTVLVTLPSIICPQDAHVPEHRGLEPESRVGRTSVSHSSPGGRTFDSNLDSNAEFLLSVLHSVSLVRGTLIDLMLHVLPAEVTLIVLSHLPISSLLPLAVLSHQWVHFFATHQSTIFHHAALYHEYISPGTSSLEEELSRNTGKPWAGSTSWKDFCKLLSRSFHRTIFSRIHNRRFTVYSACKGYRSFQFRKNWEGKGRVVARVLLPCSSPHHIKVDEKAGICITTYITGGIAVTHLFSDTVLWCLPPVCDFSAS